MFSHFWVWLMTWPKFTLGLYREVPEILIRVSQTYIYITTLNIIDLHKIWSKMIHHFLNESHNLTAKTFCNCQYYKSCLTSHFAAHLSKIHIAKPIPMCVLCSSKQPTGLHQRWVDTVSGGGEEGVLQIIGPLDRVWRRITAMFHYHTNYYIYIIKI